MSLRGRELLLVPFVAVVAAAGIILGALAVERGAVVYPLTLEFIAFGLVTAALIARKPDPGTRRFLAKVVVVAAVLRLGVLLVLQTTVPPEFFAPDVESYYALGRAWSLHWETGAPLPEALQQWQRGYPFLNAVAYDLLGDPHLALSVLNLFAGVWTVIVVYHLGARLGSERVGRIAAVLTAVFPSLILWSVLNIREATTTFVLCSTVYLAVRAYDRRGLRYLVALFFLLVLLSTLRDYMAFLAFAAILMGALAMLRPGRVGRTLMLGTVLVLFLVFSARQLGLFGDILSGETLTTIQRIRSGLASGAGSAFGTEYEVDSLSSAVRYLPVGMVYFLFAPFPWDIQSVLQLVTLPEVILWYLLFPVTLMGAWRAVLKTMPRSVIPFAVILVVVTTYTLVQGNFGTAYRHRGQVMPLLFIFSAVGLVQVWQGWGGRRDRPVRKPVLADPPRPRGVRSGTIPGS